MEFQPEQMYQLLQVDLGLTEVRPLTSDTTVSEARASALLASIFKKWEPSDSRPLEAIAVASFFKCNDDCLTVSLGGTEYVDLAIAYAKASLHDLFYSGEDQSSMFSLSDFVAFGKCGPGSSLGTKRTDFLGKMFESTLTTTDVGLRNFYESQLSSRWKAAEHARKSVWGEVELRSGNQLSTVPKNRDTNRTICTEPSLNMFFQLGAGSCIEQMLLKGHNIDLSLQPDRNKAMARDGSVSGKFSTIDLKSASDTISTTLVQHLLPRHMFALLDLIRSKTVEYNGEQRVLHMFSSMGNGFTFPLQTLIFAALVRASYEILGITPISVGKNRNYSVFGDDIICVKSAYSFVCSVLKGCGFLVNDQKSYSEGSFRESCGGDYFKGFDIRAVFLRKINGPQDAYSAFNRLARWSGRYGLFIPRTLKYLIGLVEFRPVPLDEQDTSGLKLPAALVLARKSDRNGAKYYTALIAKGKSLKICFDYGGNVDGAILCAIGGYIRNHQVGLRVKSPAWKVVRRKTPCWDRMPDAGLTAQELELALTGVLLD